MEELIGEDDFDQSSNEIATEYVLSFLWCCLKEKFKPPAISFSSNEKIDKWCNQVHDSAIHKKLPQLLEG